MAFALLAAVALFTVTGPAASPAFAVPGQTPAAPPPVPPPKAAIVVDARSGAVLEANNDRSPVAVASAFKIFTALVVHRRVKPSDLVPISRRAESMPARKINVKAGQRWTADALLHSMLLASANDAAVAMAERAGGGTTAGYERLFRREARTLHLQDHPTLHDPAGLDDESSVGGGNLISARDLAIVARAFLRQPDLASVVKLPDYRFAGGDGLQHRVVNHNRFLRSYLGAIGVKTGYTRRSGYTLIAAARRDGHTLIAIVVESANPIPQASAMLDVGFAALKHHERPLGYLPGSTEHRGLPPDRRPAADRTTVAPSKPPSSRAGPPAVSATAAAPRRHSSHRLLLGLILVTFTLCSAIALRRRTVLRRQRARRRGHDNQPRTSKAGHARREPKV